MLKVSPIAYDGGIPVTGGIYGILYGVVGVPGHRRSANLVTKPGRIVHIPRVVDYGATSAAGVGGVSRPAGITPPVEFSINLIPGAVYQVIFCQSSQLLCRKSFRYSRYELLRVEMRSMQLSYFFHYRRYAELSNYHQLLCL